MSWDGFIYLLTTIRIYVDSFITTYWEWLVIAVIFAVYAYLQPQKVKALLLKFMLQAQRKAVEFALDTGEAKMNFVIDRVYNLIPPVVRLFVSPNDLKVFAQNVFNEAKEHIKNEPYQIPPIPLEPQTPDISPEPMASNSEDSEATAPEELAEPEKVQ